MQSNELFEEYIRSKAETAYHPSCTLKMGVDKMAVVDQHVHSAKASDIFSYPHICLQRVLFFLPLEFFMKYACVDPQESWDTRFAGDCTRFR